MKNQKHKKTSNLFDLMPRIYEHEADQIRKYADAGDYDRAVEILMRQNNREMKVAREKTDRLIEKAETG